MKINLNLLILLTLLTSINIYSMKKNDITTSYTSAKRPLTYDLFVAQMAILIDIQVKFKLDNPERCTQLQKFNAQVQMSKNYSYNPLFLLALGTCASFIPYFSSTVSATMQHFWNDYPKLKICTWITGATLTSYGLFKFWKNSTKPFYINATTALPTVEEAKTPEEIKYLQAKRNYTLLKDHSRSYDYEIIKDYWGDDRSEVLKL